jgi:hypothetical protein
MHHIHQPCPELTRVTALFDDRSLTFLLAKGATLEELSDRLADLGRRQNRKPVAVTVKFDLSATKTGSEPGPRADYPLPC